MEGLGRGLLGLLPKSGRDAIDFIPVSFVAAFITGSLTFEIDSLPSSRVWFKNFYKMKRTSKTQQQSLFAAFAKVGKVKLGSSNCACAVNGIWLLLPVCIPTCSQESSCKVD